MRLFIAINFNSETKSRLIALCNELRRDFGHGRFSLPENLHLTLTFLGECDVKQTAAVKSAMDVIVFESFDLMIDSIGFYRCDGGDLWWAGVQKHEMLLKLHQNLTTALQQNGIECDKRKYSPHVTLGRKVVTKTQPREIEPFGETVAKIELMKSERIDGKLTYTAIYVKGAESTHEN